MDNAKNFDWHTNFKDWLRSQCGNMYAAWYMKQSQKTKDKIRKGISPYWIGYSLPQWVTDAIKALDRNDKETCLAIKHAVNACGTKYGEA